MPSSRWIKPTLRGHFVTLRPMAAADAAAMWEAAQDPEGMDLTHTTATFTYEQIEAWCASRAEQDERSRAQRAYEKAGFSIVGTEHEDGEEWMRMAISQSDR